MARKYKKRCDYKNCIYIKVSDDEFEFPVYIADTVAELSEMCNVPKKTISSNIAKDYNGFHRISLEEE